MTTAANVTTTNAGTIYNHTLEVTTKDDGLPYSSHITTQQQQPSDKVCNQHGLTYFVPPDAPLDDEIAFHSTLIDVLPTCPPKWSRAARLLLFEQRLWFQESHCKTLFEFPFLEQIQVRVLSSSQDGMENDPTQESSQKWPTSPPKSLRLLLQNDFAITPSQQMSFAQRLGSTNAGSRMQL